MKYKNFSMPASVFIKLATLIALTVAYLCTGCEVSKTFKTNKSDTASVKKSALVIENANETTAVRTEDSKSHEENEWFRLTLKYLAEKKDTDTTINHFITAPATVIYEGSKSRRAEETKIIDSSWYHNMMRMLALSVDSISRRVEHFEKKKHSETKGFGWIPILLIAIGLIYLTQRRKG